MTQHTSKVRKHLRRFLTADPGRSTGDGPGVPGDDPQRPGDVRAARGHHRGRVTFAADAATGRPDGIAVSPAIGPLPAIYVPLTPGEATSTALLWQATARAARRVSGWAARRLRTARPATPHSEKSDQRNNDRYASWWPPRSSPGSSASAANPHPGAASRFSHHDNHRDVIRRPTRAATEASCLTTSAQQPQRRHPADM
jgi:hypothetical protein